MARPVVGIVGNLFHINEDYRVDIGGRMVSEAVAEASGALPLIVPAAPDAVEIADLMAVCDGFLLPGGRANVHPEEYGDEPTEAHGSFDRGRDAVSLPLIRACVEAGQPIFGICRGFQDMAVAFGSTLDPEIRDLPGRMNHRMPPDGTLEEKFALRHHVHLEPGGVFHGLLGATRVLTNTLHGQGIREPGARVIVEGRAEDGTAEALRIDGAAGFALAVQWHAEWQAGVDPVSKPLFSAFGRACAEWRDGARPGRLRTA